MPAPLTRQRILQAAVELADSGGIDALSMRKLAQTLGVEAMSLYNHVRNKDDLLDGVVDVVVGEIELCPPGDDWKPAMRRQALAARQVLLRHRWAPRIIESRTTMSPVLLRYMETVVSIMRRGGFSVDLTHHAMHILGSRVLGFTQELFNDTGELDTSPEMAAIMAREMAGRIRTSPRWRWPSATKADSMIATTTSSSSSAWTWSSTGWSACAMRPPRHGPRAEPNR